jgi:dTDP-4-dehydrorhamnose 3,5-epimerase
MIPGVVVKDLKAIPDERGRLMVVLRNDEPCFTQFGQMYVTTTYPGVVKGWHAHRIQTDYICCIRGMIKLVLCMQEGKDIESLSYQWTAEISKDMSFARIIERHGHIEELFIGTHNPKLVVIPPGILHGWKCISEEESVILCMTSEPYDSQNPDEQRIDPHSNNIPYQWDRRDG